MIVWNEAPASLREMHDVKVAWAMPMYGPVPVRVMQNQMSVIAFASRYLTLHQLGRIPVVGMTDKMYLHSASNTLVEQFLETDCTHLFWTEGDMLMPFWTIPALLSHEKDICSGVYFLRNGGGQPCLYMKAERNVVTGVHGLHPVALFPEDALFQVHCPGFGCVLLHRRVFERIPRPWFDLKEGWDPVAQKKTGYGQDTYFYSKAAEAGVEVWVDSSVHCGQVDEAIISIVDYHRRITSPEFKPHGVILGEASAPGVMSRAAVPL